MMTPDALQNQEPPTSERLGDQLEIDPFTLREARPDRLDSYSELDPFDAPQAMRRLKQYELEESAASRLWLNTFWMPIGLFWITLLVLVYFNHLPAICAIAPIIPIWILRFVKYNRLRRRVAIKVTAELRGGKLSNCVECGYDLRASPERCPECGAPATVGEPIPAVSKRGH